MEAVKTLEKVAKTANSENDDHLPARISKTPVFDGFPTVSFYTSWLLGRYLGGKRVFFSVPHKYDIKKPQNRING